MTNGLKIEALLCCWFKSLILLRLEQKLGLSKLVFLQPKGNFSSESKISKLGGLSKFFSLPFAVKISHFIFAICVASIPQGVGKIEKEKEAIMRLFVKQVVRTIELEYRLLSKRDWNSYD